MADVELMSMLDQLFQAITGTGTVLTIISVIYFHHLFSLKLMMIILHIAQGFVAKDQENDKSKENAWAKTIQDGVEALDAEKGAVSHGDISQTYKDAFRNLSLELKKRIQDVKKGNDGKAPEFGGARN